MTQLSEMSDKDKEITQKIKTCGTRKTPYKADIIRLFKTYVDSTVYICGTCSSEIMMVWKKYESRYDKEYGKEA